MVMYTYTYTQFVQLTKYLVHVGFGKCAQPCIQIGCRSNRWRFTKVVQSSLALTMECLHSRAIGLRAHLEFVGTNEQNNDRIIACQLLQVVMATRHGI
jgi:hypothetical protein